MTNLYGAGKNGKRLWMRSADNRWIEIPYGSGQDPKIRSVNVWNAKKQKWMTPTWGWTVWNRDNTHTQEIDSFDVRMPGRNWRGPFDATGTAPFYNPTYPSKNTTQQFTFQPPGWQRFFYLQERVDPNWRIVPLGFKLPYHVPNTTVNYGTDEFRYFSPTSGLHTFFDYVDHTGVPFQKTETRAVSGQEFHIPITETDWSRTDPNYARRSSESMSNFFYCSLLDLKAIRQRLKDKYDQQGTDFVGQYASIDTMKIRRVYVYANVGLTHNQMGTAPPPTVSGATYQIFAKVGDDTGVGEAFSDPYWNDGTTYTVRHASGIDPKGTLVYQKNGSELIQDAVAVVPASAQNQDNTRLQRLCHLDDTVILTFENPGEDNIAFYSAITGNPILNGPTVDYWSTSLAVTSIRISIHYATDGHDTPAELHNPLALG